MLLDFINEKNKLLTGEMFLDLFVPEFRNTLDPENISTNAKPYLVDFRERSLHRYGICYENSINNTWIFFVDEEAKIIIANPHYLLNVYNSIRLTDGSGKCVTKLGEYTVIDYSIIVNEINALYSEIDKKVIGEQKDVVLNQMEDFVKEKKRTKEVQTIKGGINYGYEICYVRNKKPKMPEILKKLNEFMTTYEAAETVLSFFLDKESFIQLSTKNCEKCISEKNTEIFQHFSILKKLSSNKHDAALTTCRNVLEATKGITEELNVTTVNGEKKRVKPDDHFKYFDTSDGKGFVYLEDIQTISYKRKIIYKK